jgi:3-methyl-2-oxobutanoate hydroxymethyltransferase
MNITDFRKMKQEGRKITMVTSYDTWSARIIAQSEIDCILVGDSAAMVMHGHPSTLYATPEMMALHTAAVVRGAPKKFVVADVPFPHPRRGLSEALACIDQLMKAGANAVKIEGARGQEEVLQNIVRAGVPIMGHLGLTPQSIHQFGGFKVQAREEKAAQALLEDAKAMEEAGCFAVVLECVPSEIARKVTESLSIPTIGIGASAVTDGQVLVLQDLLGLSTEFKPKFLRQFMQGEESVKTALNSYHQAVLGKSYPAETESYT